MAAQLILDYGFIALVPFFLQASHGLIKISDNSAPRDSTSNLFRPASQPSNCLQLSLEIVKTSIYLTVLASLLLVLWIFYICYNMPVNKFEPLWANEWHVAQSDPPCWFTALIKTEDVDRELPIHQSMLCD